MAVYSTMIVVVDTLAEVSVLDTSAPLVFCVETKRLRYKNGTWNDAMADDLTLLNTKLTNNVSATNKLLGRATAGAGAVEEITCTSFVRTVLDDVDAATARATLGAGTGDMVKVTYDPNADGVIALAQLDTLVERTTAKNAASGYAGLSAGSKIAASQMTAVLASSDLTNDAALEKVANKNGVNGYAGLGAGSQVAIAQIPTGSTSSTVCIGNDARLADSRAPNGTAGGSLTGTYPNPTVAALQITNAMLAGSIDLTAKVVNMLPFANGGNQGSAATAATTGTMTVNMTTAVVSITPTGPCTFNASGGSAGQELTFVVTTSGVSSFVLTFGTNFKTTATLATGTTTAKVFTVSFRCTNGTQWVETSRTTAM